MIHSSTTSVQSDGVKKPTIPVRLAEMCHGKGTQHGAEWQKNEWMLSCSTRAKNEFHAMGKKEKKRRERARTTQMYKYKAWWDTSNRLRVRKNFWKKKIPNTRANHFRRGDFIRAASDLSSSDSETVTGSVVFSPIKSSKWTEEE